MTTTPSRPLAAASSEQPAAYYYALTLLVAAGLALGWAGLAFTMGQSKAALVLLGPSLVLGGIVSLVGASVVVGLRAK